MLQLTFPIHTNHMPRIYKVQGDIKHDTFSMLSLKLGCIESRRINGNKFEITVFKERDDVEKIITSHGLEIVETISGEEKI